MRFRFPLFALLFIAGSLAVPHLVHAGIPFFGPIIPQDATQNMCPASWGMFMTVINNVISLLITIAIVFIAPLMIAWSGFLMVVNQGNSGKITEAKGILTRTVTGIVIALAAWMIVDAIMAVLYKSPDGAWGTWSTLITSGGNGTCLSQAGVLPGDVLNPATTVPSGLVVTSPGAAGFTNQVPGQERDMSADLSALLSCMSPKLTTPTTITSISDSVISSGSHNMEYCAKTGCAHTRYSCHYGGRKCIGQSYAVDLVSSDLVSLANLAQQSCGAKTLNEGNHLHVSVGQLCGCDGNL